MAIIPTVVGEFGQTKEFNTCALGTTDDDVS